MDFTLTSLTRCILAGPARGSLGSQSAREEEKLTLTLAKTLGWSGTWAIWGLKGVHFVSRYRPACVRVCREDKTFRQLSSHFLTCIYHCVTKPNWPMMHIAVSRSVRRAALIGRCLLAAAPLPLLFY
ncbi:hypothetical protein FOCC_FOCC012540 [Frankliniella occidentalis]|nr:hypothetical protein FOCC_FOCC012540 [Frankliniella occidentalis]